MASSNPPEPARPRPPVAPGGAQPAGPDLAATPSGSGTSGGFANASLGGEMSAEDVSSAGRLPPIAGPAQDPGGLPRIVVAQAERTATAGGRADARDAASARPPAGGDAASEEAPAEDLATVAIKNAPAWLVSGVVHMLILIALALILFPTLVDNRIQLEAIYSETLGDQLEFDSPLAGNDEKNVEEPIITPDDLPWVEDPFAAPPAVDLTPGGLTATSEVTSKVPGVALSGRMEGMKPALLAAYGGNRTTEAAVQLGLKWLARNQGKDGSWSLQGPYTSGSQDEDKGSATAMALLAFQGNGHTHQKGEYAKNVERGWYWLIKQQDGDGCFFREGPFHHRFYMQGQCTIAICELYGMTKDEQYKEPAERAVKYCLDSQSGRGGWRYSPRVDGDVSVTGWILMALQSARMAGLNVPDDNLRRAGQFLDSVAMEGGSRYPYQEGKVATNTMTAEGLLCRQYLGWRRNDPRLVKGVEWLLEPENQINFNQGRNVYYWYYATQVMHHMGGEYWDRWNGVMRQAVPEQQVKTGREAGSWDPQKPSRDEWGRFGGRLYVTCLSLYILEVYYRHLPLYENVYTTMGGP